MNCRRVYALLWFLPVATLFVLVENVHAQSSVPIPNAGFEESTLIPPSMSPWQVWQRQQASWSIAFGPERVHSGDKSLRLTVEPNRAARIDVRQNVTPLLISGVTYRFSVWVKSDSVLARPTAWLEIFRGTRNQSSAWASVQPQGTAWQQISVDYRLEGPGDLSVSLGLLQQWEPVGSADVLFDDVAVDVVSLPPLGPPIIESVSPHFGRAGDRVRIAGANFQIQPSDQIFFGDQPATITGRAPDQFNVIVPPHSERLPGAVSVSVLRSSTGERSDFLKFLYIAPSDQPPVITAVRRRYLPVTGTPEVSNCVFGFYFGADPALRIDGVAVPTEQILVGNDRMICFIAPARAAAGPAALEVESEDGADLLGEGLVYVDPEEEPDGVQIYQVDPPRVVQGMEGVRIFGRGFSFGPEDIWVTIDGVPAPVLSAAYDELEIAIPADAPVGEHTLNVFYAGNRNGAYDEVRVEVLGAAPDSCQIGRFDARSRSGFPEPIFRAFSEGQGGFPGDAIYLSAAPSGPPCPQLRFKRTEASNWTAARRCDASLDCSRVRSWAVPLADEFDSFITEPTRLDVQITCPGGASAVLPRPYFDYFVMPQQITRSETLPPDVDPGAPVAIRTRDVVQTVNGQDRIVGLYQVILYQRQYDAITWQKIYRLTAGEICVADAGDCSGSVPVRIERTADPREQDVRILIPTAVPRGNDLFIVLSYIITGCGMETGEEATFRTVRCHIRSSGQVGVNVMPLVRFLPSAGDPASVSYTVSLTAQAGFAGNVRLLAHFQGSTPSPASSIRLSFAGSDAAERVVTLGAGQTLSVPLSVTRNGAATTGEFTIRVDAYAPPDATVAVASLDVTLQINEGLRLLPIATVLPTGRQGQLYQVDLEARGGAGNYSWELCYHPFPAQPLLANCLPPGLSARLIENNTKLRIAGIPSRPVFNHQLQARVQDASLSDSARIYRMSIAAESTLAVCYRQTPDGPVRCGDTTLPNGRVGQPYQVRFEGQGGTPGPPPGRSYDWQLCGEPFYTAVPTELYPCLPRGLRAVLTANGTAVAVSGTPSGVVSNVDIPVTLTDATGSTMAKTYWISVMAAPAGPLSLSITPSLDRLVKPDARSFRSFTELLSAQEVLYTFAVNGLAFEDRNNARIELISGPWGSVNPPQVITRADDNPGYIGWQAGPPMQFRYRGQWQRKVVWIKSARQAQYELYHQPDLDTTTWSGTYTFRVVHGARSATSSITINGNNLMLSLWQTLSENPSLQFSLTRDYLVDFLPRQEDMYLVAEPGTSPGSVRIYQPAQALTPLLRACCHPGWTGSSPDRRTFRFTMPVSDFNPQAGRYYYMGESPFGTTCCSSQSTPVGFLEVRE